MLEKPKLSCDIDLIIIKVNREPSEKEIVEFHRNFYTAIIDHAGHWWLRFYFALTMQDT